jgi:hypothetical protein
MFFGSESVAIVKSGPESQKFCAFIDAVAASIALVQANDADDSGAQPLLPEL